MRSAPERTRKPAEDRRREIADAALRVIAAQGLRRFTSIAIAREVGVSDAALFRHFPSKEAIVDAAIDRVEELLFERFPPEADDPVARLGAFFRHRVRVVQRSPAISSLVASDELEKAGSAEAARRVAALRRRSTRFVRACLREAERRRLLAAGLGAEEASVVVLGAILALAHARVVGELPPEPLTERVWSALESFLRGPEARSRDAGRRPPRDLGRHGRGGRP